MRSIREFLGTTTLLPRAKTFCLRLMAAVLLFALGYFCKDFERSLETRKLLARGDSGDEYRGIRLKAFMVVADFRKGILASNNKQWDEAYEALESAYAESLLINAVLAQRLAHVCFLKRDFAQAYNKFSAMLDTGENLEGFYEEYVLGSGRIVAEIYISCMFENRLDTADAFLTDVKAKVKPEGKVGQYIALLFSPSEPSMSDPRMALLTSDTMKEIKEYRALMAEVKDKKGKKGNRAE
jgi:tetratricopeptide (TPR) repeat protein